MYWVKILFQHPHSPTIVSADATDDQITITLDDFPGDKAALVSRLSHRICGATTVETSDTAVTITGLDGDTDYSCSVTASNAQGDSPALVQVVTTDGALKGLNIILMCSMIDCNAATT